MRGPDAGGRPSRPLGVVRSYLCVLPVTAMLTFYFLAADRMTAATPEELVHARYGWPIDWVEQDLSRHQPASFPVTLDFNWQRAWHDPVVTSYDWPAFVLNVLLVGLAVTAGLYAVAPVIKRLLARGRRTPDA